MREALGDEEWLVVLAVGTTTPFESAQPLVQALGTRAFTLVDVTVRDASTLSEGERLWVRGIGCWESNANSSHRNSLLRYGPYSLGPSTSGNLCKLVLVLTELIERFSPRTGSEQVPILDYLQKLS